MPRTTRAGALLLVVALVGGCASAPSPSGSAPATAPASASAPTGSAGAAVYLDPAAPVEARVEDLLGRMTVEEKIGQLTLIENGSVDPAGVERMLLGGVLSGGDGNPSPNTPDGWFAMVDGYQVAALRTRLRIPILYGIDAIHGQSHVVGGTYFPHEIGLGATRDAALVEQIGRATARETAATGVRWTFGPIVAVPQDVRWGRTYEAYGQDPALVGDLSTALIRGLQGGDLKRDDAVAATAKHFVGDGGTAWGSSTYEDYEIDRGVTSADDAALRSIHLAPYRAAIAAGARIVMASFSSTSAGKVHGDRHLLTDVLKGELGFTGFVVSDWGGVDEIVPGDLDSSVAQAISAGIDLVMVPYDAAAFQAAVRRGLDGGRITADRLDDAVRRILRVKMEMGLFEHPMPTVDRSVVGSAANRKLAADAVAESAVLLRASDGVLPVGAGDGQVLLAGAAADDLGTQLGGWSITWQGGPGAPTAGTTLRQALTDRLGSRVAYDRGAAFPGATSRAPLGIVVVAEPPYAEGKGDSATLALAASELDVVDRMRSLVNRLVVVIYSGRPVMLDRLANADAIVAAWLPGTEAEGLADVLTGEQPFAGVTPDAWPRTPDDAPRTGKEPCDGAVYSAGYGLAADGTPLGPTACPTP
ncbi:MAG TPA: glycoside hydrolase family 3 protein [Candidatus Limnocylindrales bacterium]